MTRPILRDHEARRVRLAEGLATEEADGGGGEYGDQRDRPGENGQLRVLHRPGCAASGLRSSMPAQAPAQVMANANGRQTPTASSASPSPPRSTVSMSTRRQHPAAGQHLRAGRGSPRARGGWTQREQDKLVRADNDFTAKFEQWRQRLAATGMFDHFLRIMTDEVDPDARETRDERFEFGLDCVLEGVAAMLAKGPA